MKHKENKVKNMPKLFFMHTLRKTLEIQEEMNLNKNLPPPRFHNEINLYFNITCIISMPNFKGAFL
jgi:hypothetical protein